MSRTCSISARRVYGGARVCRLWGVARSSHYSRRARANRPIPPRSRGRKPVLRDEALVGKIREVLSEAEGLGFSGEGYRKVRARLRFAGIPTSKERVRCLMWEHGLQAPHRLGSHPAPRTNDGTIIPDAPNRMWSTDATQVRARKEGVATVFVAIDPFVGDVVGIHAARPGTRFEALEPIHQGIRDFTYSPLAKDIAKGLVLRHDHGPQYMSHTFQQEVTFLGVEASLSFVRTPEGNVVAERFICTLKEQLVWVWTFDTVEELRLAFLAFKERLNRHWWLQRHGFKTPAEVRTQNEPAKEGA